MYLKIAVECKSPLLQKSLEVFLSKHLSTVKQCDILIKDEKVPNNKKCFYISSSPEEEKAPPFGFAILGSLFASVFLLSGTVWRETGGMTQKVQRSYFLIPAQIFSFTSVRSYIIQKRKNCIRKI